MLCAAWNINLIKLKSCHVTNLLVPPKKCFSQSEICAPFSCANKISLQYNVHVMALYSQLLNRREIYHMGI
jgi:hypothetical protein